LGSAIGQHSFFNPQCRVREEQPALRKYVPHYGYIEMRAKFAASASDVVALWMIGYEDAPERSAELCIMEIKGWQVEPHKSKIGMGLRQFNDPKIVTDFTEDTYPIDVTEFHRYAVCWTSDKVVLYIDGAIVRSINQSPDYPMQLMLGIYELPEQLMLLRCDTRRSSWWIMYMGMK
jgi:beta-glucanase (GH16 family)